MLVAAKFPPSLSTTRYEWTTIVQLLRLEEEETEAGERA